MSACIENFLSSRDRQMMRCLRDLVSGVALSMLVGACVDGHGSAVAAPPLSARAQADIEEIEEGKPAAADFDATVPIAYYQLSLNFSRTTAGFTPPVQARAFGYMGIALYEAVVGGMPDHRSIASQLNGIGSLPQSRGIPYNWALVANAAMAEVMRGLWGDKTNHAADNIAALNALEAQLASQYSAGVPPGIGKL